MKSNSIMLLGERHPNKIVWVQLYDSSQQLEEEELRKVILEISDQISNNKIKKASARKFLSGKLIYYEIDRTPEELSRNKIICLFTKDNTIGSETKKAIEKVGFRGGIFSIYSAKRFFNELIDLLSDPDALEEENVLVEDAVRKISEFDGRMMSKNELGQVISLINRSQEMDHDTVEKLYFLVYENIESISVESEKMEDLDEFLDASYIIARKYQETPNFYLALELFKKIIPLASRNKRLDLETVCAIQIATIYKLFFPSPGDYILNTFEDIVDENHLNETSKSNKEIYYCLRGFAYENLKKYEHAKREYEKAIQESPIVGSPLWIADAYRFLGELSEMELKYTNSIRYYLTAAAICFADGDLSQADFYRDLAGGIELKMADSLIHTSIIASNEGNFVDSEYRAWDGLRSLIKSYLHTSPQKYLKLESKTNEILNIANYILSENDSKSKNKKVIRNLRNGLEEIRLLEVKTTSEIDTLENFSKKINENLPIPPPTFMLLTLDGRMVTTGQIEDNEWKKGKFKGVLLSGILSAIMSLISEVAGQESLLKTVDTGSFQIMLEQTKNLASVLLVDRELPIFRKYLIDCVNEIDTEYGSTLRFWDGYHDNNMVKGISDIVLNIFAQ